MLVVEGVVVVVLVLLLVVDVLDDFVVLRVVLEVVEVVVEVVVLFFNRLRRSLQLGFSVVVGTKFHHFLIWVVMVDNGKVMMSHYSIYKITIKY